MGTILFLGEAITGFDVGLGSVAVAVPNDGVISIEGEINFVCVPAYACLSSLSLVCGITGDRDFILNDPVWL